VTIGRNGRSVFLFYMVLTSIHSAFARIELIIVVVLSTGKIVRKYWQSLWPASFAVLFRNTL